jgi:choline dehydrogenase
MNMALPPDSDWTEIATLTGDDSWLPDNIRDIYTRLENNHYMPEGTPGYGFDGWLGVSTSSRFFGNPDRIYQAKIV